MNTFTLISLFYSILLNFIVFYKKTIKSFENSLFKSLLIVNLIGVLLALSSYFTIINIDNIPIINEIVSKGYILYLLTYIIIFTVYIFSISINDDIDENKKNIKQKRILKIISYIYIILFVVISLLPLYYHNENGAVYSYGPCASGMYIISFILIVVWIIRLLINFKVIKIKKYIPIFGFMIFSGIVAIIQKIHPELLLMTSMETFIVYLMYFTIENPDVKMLSELNKSKEISDKANEEKTIFLYNMTQDIKEITNKIDEDTNIILESKDVDQIYDITRDIKSNSSKFITLTNDVFDVSTLDQANIKVYNCKYNIKLLIKEIINVYSKICNEKELEFITNIDNNIPNSLYGDSINLKDVLNKIITNSIKTTNKGFIEFDINTIIKNDICRLIINIEDSSNGIKSEDINKVLLENTELGEVNKIVTLIGGTMIISSNYGFGNKIKIIIDQKINIEEDSNIKKYEEVFDNTKILVIDDSDSSIKIINKLLKSTNVIMDSSLNGKDAINNIKVNKYDLILLDEELSSISGKELLSRLKEIRGFDSRVILLTKDNNYEYNDKYLEEGFSDYLLKPIKKDKLLDIIDKYKKG